MNQVAVGNVLDDRIVRNLAHADFIAAVADANSRAERISWPYQPWRQVAGNVNAAHRIVTSVSRTSRSLNEYVNRHFITWQFLLWRRASRESQCCINRVDDRVLTIAKVGELTGLQGSRQEHNTKRTVGFICRWFTIWNKEARHQPAFRMLPSSDGTT